MLKTKKLKRHVYGLFPSRIVYLPSDNPYIPSIHSEQVQLMAEIGRIQNKLIELFQQKGPSRMQHIREQSERKHENITKLHQINHQLQINSGQAFERPWQRGCAITFANADDYENPSHHHNTHNKHYAISYALQQQQSIQEGEDPNNTNNSSSSNVRPFFYLSFC